MDKKKKITTIKLLVFCVLLACVSSIHAQSNRRVNFCEHSYGNDSITLFLSFTDDAGNKIAKTNLNDLYDYSFYEDGNIIEPERITISNVTTGKRIPDDCTFSVLVDLSIPQTGKTGIFEAVKSLVESAPDSCVYLSFFGENVTSSKLVNQQNIMNYKKEFMKPSPVKHLYGALYSKLDEFAFAPQMLEEYVHKEEGYRKDSTICFRAMQTHKNYLFLFIDGDHRPQSEEHIHPWDITELHRDTTITPKPRIFAFYYTETDVLSDNVEPTLKGLTINEKIPEKYRGQYYRSNDLDTVLFNFKELVNEEMYDYAFKYRMTENKSYHGMVQYVAKTGQNEKGHGAFPIASLENELSVKGSNPFLKYLKAILITLLTIVFFFFIIKVLIPAIKSKLFAVKYYKKYVPEENVQSRICHYCRQPIHPGQTVVTKCKHIMHVDCWQQNGYKCAEFGQNCKEGIQEHVDWSELFKLGSLHDFYLTMEGILAGFVCWIIYSLFSKKPFTGLASIIVNTFLKNPEITGQVSVLKDYVDKVASFLLIGLLLGFFMSIVFRYNDGPRKNDWRSLLKLFGLSVLSAIIGTAAFLIGSIVFCLLLPSNGIVDINLWYYSFPAYLLFSALTSLSFTIKSTIPVKSALLGGICSAVIGFLVLYFSNFNNERNSWMSMYLNFAIYGGGLGASLVTVRMLAERYFLVIKNGIRAGQRIPIHKWMNATGGGNIVTIGMTERCEIQMTWEKSNKVAKEHVQLFVDHSRSQAMLRPLATGVVFNTRMDLPAGKPVPLNNMDTFNVGDTVFQYIEN